MVKFLSLYIKFRNIFKFIIYNNIFRNLNRGIYIYIGKYMFFYTFGWKEGFK